MRDRHEKGDFFSFELAAVAAVANRDWKGKLRK
jgi:hypothetical protein